MVRRLRIKRVGPALQSNVNGRGWAVKDWELFVFGLLACEDGVGWFLMNALCYAGKCTPANPGRT